MRVTRVALPRRQWPPHRHQHFPDASQRDDTGMFAGREVGEN